MKPHTSTVRGFALDALARSLFPRPKRIDLPSDIGPEEAGEPQDWSDGRECFARRTVGTRKAVTCRMMIPPAVIRKAPRNDFKSTSRRYLRPARQHLCRRSADTEEEGGGGRAGKRKGFR